MSGRAGKPACSFRSWSSRKRLVQDTIVVLVTVVLMTLFLLLVDMFWGWLLSTVLPSVARCSGYRS
mgnify:CR=1 FL=1